MITPTHPYWPLTPGRIIDFAVFRTTGQFHPATLHLDVTSRALDQVKPYQSVVCLRIPSAKPTIALVQFESHLPAPTLADVDMDGQLTEGLWKPPTGAAWIGEDVNQVPPLPKLPLDTTVCPPWSGQSRAVNYYPDGSNSGFTEVPWKFAVHHNGARWGAWPDTVRTALYESGNVFNYVFARGVGLVDYWYTYSGINPDNSCVGIHMFGIGTRSA